MRNVTERQKGQTLMELIVALGVLGIVFSALALAINTSFINTQFSKNQDLSNQFAQEAMEIVRSIRQSDPSFFNSESLNEYCLDKGSQTLRPKGAGCGQNVDSFVREVSIEQNAPPCTEDTVKVVVRVRFSDSKCVRGMPFCHTVEQSSCFSDVFSVPTPGVNTISPSQ